MYNEDNNNSSNNGNRGKWSERLYKMRKNRLKIRKNRTLNDEDISLIKNISRNIFKVILALPNMIYTNIIDSNKNKDNRKNNIGRNKDSNSKNNICKSDNVTDFELDELVFDIKLEKDNDKRIKVNKIKNIDITLLRKNRDYLLNNIDLINNKNIVSNVDYEIKKVELQKEIINLIKKKLVKSINELEILQSELYILNQLEQGDIYLIECQQDIKNIKKLLSKVNSLKDRYDYLKDNVDFEYMLEHDDDLLVDKILELKEICSRSDIKQTIDDYKILDEYKYLYLKIDKLQDQVIKFDEYKNNKKDELRQRDIDFDIMKNDVYDIDREKEKYVDFVNKQEIILRDLDEKINKIDFYEKVSYRLKGFNQLLGNSFKYLGLLLVNPLKGVVPGIAMQTLVTKNTIRNLYNSLEWEENRKIEYDAIDYSYSINIMIDNLDNMSSMIDSTLEDIIKLKSKYMNEFSQYENSFSSYRNTIKKMNKIENAVFGSKIKIEIMKSRMKEKENENNNKLLMVKKLNSVDK